MQTSISSANAGVDSLSARIGQTWDRAIALTEWSRQLTAVSGPLVRRRIRGGSDRRETRAQRTLDKARRGGLPAPFQSGAWVGRGGSKTCDGCGEVITCDEREFEIERCATLIFRFHAECHGAWMTFTGRGYSESQRLSDAS
ncbi:MAG TPA: hypothetical protein VIE36_15180 [Methylomirabilota bacterium]|jgi:hypothetical protein